jgi:hypothetical protein
MIFGTSTVVRGSVQRGPGNTYAHPPAPGKTSNQGDKGEKGEMWKKDNQQYRERRKTRHEWKRREMEEVAEEEHHTCSAQCSRGSSLIHDNHSSTAIVTNHHQPSPASPINGVAHPHS